MRLSSFVVFILLVFALVGCGSKEAQVVGEWTPSQGGNGTLSMKADKTFVMGSGGASAAEGSWAISGNKVTLTVAKLGGQPVADLKTKMKGMGMKDEDLAKMDKPLEGDLSEDGKTITVKGDASTGGQQLTFTKK